MRKAPPLSADPRERNRLRDFRTYLVTENHRRFENLPLGDTSLHHFSLRTYRETLPPFALPVEMVQRERERGRETFREISGNLPVLKGPRSSLGMAIKLLSQDYSWIPVI